MKVKPNINSIEVHLVDGVLMNVGLQWLAHCASILGNGEGVKHKVWAHTMVKVGILA
jgi:hypothetical protein